MTKIARNRSWIESCKIFIYFTLCVDTGSLPKYSDLQSSASLLSASMLLLVLLNVL